jgi:hypothetical protein
MGTTQEEHGELKKEVREMKSFIEYLNEAMKKPNIVQGIVSPRARKARKVYDANEKRKLEKRQAYYDDMEAKVRGEMGWTTDTNAAT